MLSWDNCSSYYHFSVQPWLYKTLFSRSFMGKDLEREVAYLIDQGVHSQSLAPVKPYIDLPKQLDFFDPNFGLTLEERANGSLFNLNAPGVRKYANNVTLATYYELLSASLYGGKLFNQLYVLDHEGEVTRRAGAPSLNGLSSYEEIIKLVKPDIIDQETHSALEIKAFLSGRPYKFRDAQMEGYLDLQRSMPSDTTIDFVIYRHTVRDFTPPETLKRHSAKKHSRISLPNSRRNYSDEELYAALAQHTAHSVVVPINLMNIVCTRSGNSSWTFRDEGIITAQQNKYLAGMQVREPGTYLKSPSANQILINPEEFLRDHGQNLDDYEIERLRSPDHYQFGSSLIKPFPITRIRYKHYRTWATRLREYSPSIPVQARPDESDEHYEPIFDDSANLEEVIDENRPF